MAIRRSCEIWRAGGSNDVLNEAAGSSGEHCHPTHGQRGSGAGANLSCRHEARSLGAILARARRRTTFDDHGGGLGVRRERRTACEHRRVPRRRRYAIDLKQRRREMDFSVHDSADGGARGACEDWARGADVRWHPHVGHKPRSMPVSLRKSWRQSSRDSIPSQSGAAVACCDVSLSAACRAARATGSLELTLPAA